MGYGDCLEVRMENNRNCSVLDCVQFLNLHDGLELDFVFVCLFRFSTFVCFVLLLILILYCASLHHFIRVLLVFCVVI